jgi:NAD dependent epimerase/dehydratase family enzyme
VLLLYLLRRWTPAIKKQIKQSRLDITSKVAVSASNWLAADQHLTNVFVPAL